MNSPSWGPYEHDPQVHLKVNDVDSCCVIFARKYNIVIILFILQKQFLN